MADETPPPPHTSTTTPPELLEESPPPPPPPPPPPSHPESADTEAPPPTPPPPPAAEAKPQSEQEQAPPEEAQPPPEEAQPPPQPTQPPAAPEEAIVESEKEKGKSSFIHPAVSFKEESYLITDLSEIDRKTLQELKNLISQSISDQTLLPQNPNSSSSSEEPISIWGIPLMEDERSDVVLLKFLRAREFKVAEAFQMLKNTLQWRREFRIEELLDEDLGDDLEKVVFMHGHDRDGHPVCYNVYGEFQNKELYGKTFGSEEKREKFLRWRIQFLERSIRELNFRPGGVTSFFQVNDLKNAPGPGKRELRQATRKALQLLQDNYPEFVVKQVFINVPWWYVAFYTMMSPFMTQRTKSKFVFAGPSKTAETLFKYASPEQVPIQYGGLSVDYCECNPEFTVEDPATVINLRSATKQYVEIICNEKCFIVWEVRVVGWEVTYSAEFAPSAKDGYVVIIQKATKMAPNDNPVISGSFKITEVGKIVLTIDNPTFKKRKLLYRYKVLPLSD